MAIVIPEVDWDSGSTVTNNYVVFTTAETPVLTTGTDSIASRVIANTVINGKKIMVGIDVTAGFNDVAGELTVELSADGTNWSPTFATAIADSTPNVTGVKLGLVDFTNTQIPFMRLRFNSAGNNLGTSGQLKFKYIVPPA